MEYNSFSYEQCEHTVKYDKKGHDFGEPVLSVAEKCLLFTDQFALKDTLLYINKPTYTFCFIRILQINLKRCLRTSLASGPHSQVKMISPGRESNPQLQIYLQHLLKYKRSNRSIV